MKRYARFIWDDYDDGYRGWDNLSETADDLGEMLGLGISSTEYGHIVDLETGKIIYRMGRKFRDAAHLKESPVWVKVDEVGDE